MFDRGNKFGGGKGGKRYGGKDSGNRSYGGDRGFRGDSGRTVMHKAICGECGRPCEVPFKPNSDRPVYCNSCFNKDENGNPRPKKDSGKSFGGGNYTGGNKTDQFDEQFAILNAKLDEILEALTSIAEDEDEDEDEKA